MLLFERNYFFAFIQGISASIAVQTSIKSKSQSYCYDNGQFSFSFFIDEFFIINCHNTHNKQIV